MGLNSPHSRLGRMPLAWVLPWAGMGVCLLLLIAVLAHDRLFGASSAGPGRGGPSAESASTSPTAATVVTLPPGKLKAARIATEPATVVALPTEVGVAGWIEANADHRVDVRPRAAGVIREVPVVLGQKVKKGDVLVVLDSADVGTARLNLRSKQRELTIARNEAEWKEEIAKNVAEIIPRLRKGVSAAKLEVEFADRPLGQNRALLLQAYSELEIASHEEIKQGELHKQRIVGEHPAFLAIHTREGAQAKFEAALEVVRFDAAQQRRVAEQQMRVAESAVIDAAQRLRILGVREDVAALLSNPLKPGSAAESQEDVTGYEIVAPFSGTIISKAAVPSQKADVNDVLFSLADVSNVWVMANIPESDFGILPRFERGTIRLTATAYPGRTFEAKLLSIGSVVDQTSRTVPLLAETANPEGLLKLGMFVRIVFDGADRDRALTVPAAAVVEIEQRKGVFLPSAKAANTFAFRPVATGREAAGRQVIVAGLHEGERVVSSGAFLLKSELILQNSADED